jgi:hypothetical protein
MTEGWQTLNRREGGERERTEINSTQPGTNNTRESRTKNRARSEREKTRVVSRSA